MRFQKPNSLVAMSLASVSPTVGPAEIVDIHSAAFGEEVVDFRGYFKVDVFPHNAVVYRAGDAADRVFLLKRGRVRLMRVGRNGVRSVLALLKQDDLFGEMFADEGALLEETAVASGEAEVWSIDGREFKSLLESRPTVARDIVRAQASRQRHLKRRLVGMTFKEVPARLAETILQLAETVGEHCPHGGEVDLRGVTQQDLADLVGASRSFVSTLVNEMKRDGSLGNVGRVMCVRDQRALRQFASKER